MILAPLRGVTVRRFRQTFGALAAQCGFTEAVTPFVAAMKGVDPMKDAELRGGPAAEKGARLAIVPQFIGKDPDALRECLRRVRGAGYALADLNCGCPFPMVRRKGRGSGLLRTPDVLARMLEAGCEVMGEGCFSAKTRLGLESPDELARLMDVFNAFPLRHVAIHARTAAQMYSGECDAAAFRAAAALAKMPVVYNGDVRIENGAALAPEGVAGPDGRLPRLMCGRGFVVAVGRRDDAPALLERYIRDSLDDGMPPGAVLGRMKELLAYWAVLPRWAGVWRKAKKERSLAAFEAAALETLQRSPATCRRADMV